MKKEKSLRILIFISAFLLGVFLRLWKYPFYPFAGHAEEYLFVWSGLSLIEQGIPISWSDLPVYGEKYVYWRGEAVNPAGGKGLGVRLLKPWLDEPPLYSLIVGGMAKLYHLENFTLISPYVIRIPSLIFSFINLGLVFLLSQKFFGYWIAILSLLIYGTTPTFVFGSRLAVPENMITTLMLAVILLLVGYLKSGKIWQRNLAIIFAGVAGLAKPTGFLLVPFLAFLLMREKKWHEGISAGVIGSLLFWIPYLAYGFYFDPKLFLEVLLYQAQRPAGWSGLVYLITHPGFSIEVFLDGFVVLGFLSLVWLIFKKKNQNEETILFAFIYSILVVIISGGKHDQLTWYRYPIYPFASISAALLMKEVFSSPNLFNLSFFIPVFLTNSDLLENPFWRFNFFLHSRVYRFFLVVFLLPSVLHFFSKKKVFLWISKGILLLVIFLGFFFNCWVVKSYFNLLCDNTMCALPHKVNLLSP